LKRKKQEFRKEKQLKKERKEKEKQRQIQAEHKRKEEERLASQRAAEEERKKKFDEQARKQREREAAIEKKLEEASKPIPSTTRRPTPHKENDKTDSPSWRRKQQGNEDNNQSRIDTKENWRDQRPRGGNDRRLDEPSTNKGASSESWKSKPRSEQQNRDDKRGVASPSSSERRTEQTSEKGDSWRTVEKKRPNPPRTDNDRPLQQRSGESSSSGVWRPKSRVPDESRDNIRSSPNSSNNWARSDENTNWRTREKKTFEQLACE